MDIGKKMLEAVKSNGKIIPRRCERTYFINNKLEHLLVAWEEATKELVDFYPDMPDRIMASAESCSLLMCKTCGVVPRMISRENRKFLSLYCSPTCAQKSSEKSDKLRQSLTDEIKDGAKIKRAKTMIEKYGYEYTLQRPEMKELLLGSKLPVDVLDKLTSKEWIEKEYVIGMKSLTMLGEELGIYYGTVGEYIEKSGYSIRPSAKDSMPELFIKGILDEYGIQYETNKRKILSDAKHLDFYIESKNLAIEYNGNWHHQENIRPKGYHKKKASDCNNVGVNLLHFYTKDYIKRKDKMKSIILHHLGLSNKIYARKCTIDIVEDKEATNFLNDNHMQESCGSSVKIGLYYNTELVSIMTFGKPRYDKNHQYELLRYCTKLNHVVVGGASKLFKYFLKQYKPTSIISYCMIDRSNDGDIYHKLGMNQLEGQSDSYFWAKGDMQLSRYQTTVKSLPKLFGEKYNKDYPTEDGQLTFHGWYKVWTCGNYKFSWKAKTEV